MSTTWRCPRCWSQLRGVPVEDGIEMISCAPCARSWAVNWHGVIVRLPFYLGLGAN